MRNSDRRDPEPCRNIDDICGSLREGFRIPSDASLRSPREQILRKIPSGSRKSKEIERSGVSLSHRADDFSRLALVTLSPGDVNASANVSRKLQHPRASPQRGRTVTFPSYGGKCKRRSNGVVIPESKSSLSSRGRRRRRTVSGRLWCYAKVIEEILEVKRRSCSFMAVYAFLSFQPRS